MTKNSSSAKPSSEGDSTVEGHLRPAIAPPKRPVCLREEMERLMDEADSAQTWICFDRMNLEGKTSLRIRIIDKDAITFTEVADEEAALLYYRLTGDPGFISSVSAP